MRTPAARRGQRHVPAATCLRPRPIALNAIGLAVLLIAAEVVPRLAPHHDLATGLRHAQDLVDLERRLGLPDERGPMRWLAARPALEDAANVAYVAFHVPAIAATLVWTYLTRPRLFAWMRVAFVVAMLLTIAGYTLLPMAPPRFLSGAPDGAAELYGSAARPSGDGAVNALAAFPSGHVVFALLAALPVVRCAPRAAVRALAAAYPVLVTALVIATGHHFWLDVASAVAVVAIATAAAVAPAGLRAGRSPVGEPTPVAAP
jgi:PAP2 superfamily